MPGKEGPRAEFDEDFERETAAQMGLPPGWRLRTYANGNRRYLTPEGEHCLTLSAVKDILGYIPVARKRKSGPAAEPKADKPRGDVTVRSKNIQNFNPGWEARLGFEPVEEWQSNSDLPAGWRCAIKIEPSGKRRKVYISCSGKCTKNRNEVQPLDGVTEEGGQASSSNLQEQADTGVQEKRYDGSEGPFTYEQFEDFYGKEKAKKKWKKAASKAPGEKREKKREADGPLQKKSKKEKAQFDKTSTKGKASIEAEADEEKPDSKKENAQFDKTSTKGNASTEAEAGEEKPAFSDSSSSSEDSSSSSALAKNEDVSESATIAAPQDKPGRQELNSPAVKAEARASLESGGGQPAVATSPGNASSSNDHMESVADKLQKVVEMMTKGQLTESEFRKMKKHLLSAGSRNVFEEICKLASMHSQGWLTAEEFNCAKASYLFPESPCDLE